MNARIRLADKSVASSIIIQRAINVDPFKFNQVEKTDFYVWPDNEINNL